MWEIDILIRSGGHSRHLKTSLRYDAMDEVIVVGEGYLIDRFLQLLSTVMFVDRSLPQLIVQARL